LSLSSQSWIIKHWKFLGAGLLIGAGLGVLVLTALGVGISAFSADNQAIEEDIQLQAPVNDSLAPNFKLQNLSGDPIQLMDLRGKMVLVNFWATWCLPCEQEMPLIEEYYQRYSPNLVVLAVNADEPPDVVRSFVDKLQLSFEILLDPASRIDHLYKVRAYPTTIFIDKDGMIRFRHIGLLQEKQLSAYLEEIGVGK
jgi:cytochrome c biogenesis protein CcmG/thiol:disulfide interchange protein DsbE